MNRQMCSFCQGRGILHDTEDGNEIVCPKCLGWGKTNIVEEELKKDDN